MITTALNPRQHSAFGHDFLMDNQFKVVSAFLLLNAAIIASAALLYMKGGMNFGKVLSYLAQS